MEWATTSVLFFFFFTAYEEESDFRVRTNLYSKVRPFVTSERESCPDITHPFHCLNSERHLNLSPFLLLSLSKISLTLPILLPTSFAILSMSVLSLKRCQNSVPPILLQHNCVTLLRHRTLHSQKYKK